MKFSEGMAVIEAVLFACGEPIDAAKLSEACEIEKDTVLKIIDRLNDRYTENGSAFRINRLGDSYQMMTQPQFAPYIKTALETRRQVPLSQAAMEVLAVVAYNQPVTKSFVEQVRRSRQLRRCEQPCGARLLEEYGRLDLPGRPIAYKTTENFLRCFGLTDIKGLPAIPDSTDQIDLEEFDEMNFSGSD